LVTGTVEVLHQRKDDLMRFRRVADARTHTHTHTHTNLDIETHIHTPASVAQTRAPYLASQLWLAGRKRWGYPNLPWALC